jgi:hypothetical protein
MPKDSQRTQQCYRTPPEFLAAALRRFNKERFDFDLACSSHDKVAPFGFEYPLCNAFDQDWHDELEPEWLSWINPTFNICGAWAAKCASSKRQILGLFPASVSTVWFREHVAPDAFWIAFQPRLFFLYPDGTPILGSNGKPTPIDRDCVLISWGMGLKPGYACEDWRGW